MAARTTAVALPLASRFNEGKILVWEKQFHQMSKCKWARCLHMTDRDKEARWGMVFRYQTAVLLVFFHLNPTISSLTWCFFPAAFQFLVLSHFSLTDCVHPFLFSPPCFSLSRSPSSYFLYKTTDKKINPLWFCVCDWYHWLPGCRVSRLSFCIIYDSNPQASSLKTKLQLGHNTCPPQSCYLSHSISFSMSLFLLLFPQWFLIG